MALQQYSNVRRPYIKCSKQIVKSKSSEYSILPPPKLNLGNLTKSSTYLYFSRWLNAGIIVIINVFALTNT
jgi:hypothetical protein